MTCFCFIGCELSPVRHPLFSMEHLAQVKIVAAMYLLGVWAGVVMLHKALKCHLQYGSCLHNNIELASI